MCDSGFYASTLCAVHSSFDWVLVFIWAFCVVLVFVVFDILRVDKTWIRCHFGLPPVAASATYCRESALMVSVSVCLRAVV